MSVGLRAVAFDYFETLVTRPLGRASQHGVELGLPAEFDGIWKSWGERRLTEPVGYTELLHAVYQRAGAPVDEALVARLTAERTDQQASLLRDIEQPMLDMVAACRTEGMAIAIVSNAAVEDVTGWDESRLASLVDVPGFSFAAGVAKPDPAIYTWAATRLAVDPDQMAVVSDAISDLRAAQRAGVTRCVWATWFLNRRAEHGATTDLAGDRPGAGMSRADAPEDVCRLVLAP